MSLTRARSSFTKTTASWTVLNIFQLPAMNGILMLIRSAEASRYTALRVAERGHTGQRSAAEEFERGATACRDVRDAVGDAGVLHRRDRIAAADDRRPLDGSDRAGDRDRAGGKHLDLEDAHRSIPHDCLG